MGNNKEGETDGQKTDYKGRLVARGFQEKEVLETEFILTNSTSRRSRLFGR